MECVDFGRRRRVVQPPSAFSVRSGCRGAEWCLPRPGRKSRGEKKKNPSHNYVSSVWICKQNKKKIKITQNNQEEIFFSKCNATKSNKKPGRNLTESRCCSRNIPLQSIVQKRKKQQKNHPKKKKKKKVFNLHLKWVSIPMTVGSFVSLSEKSVGENRCKPGEF